MWPPRDCELLEGRNCAFSKEQTWLAKHSKGVCKDERGFLPSIVLGKWRKSIPALEIHKPYSLIKGYEKSFQWKAKLSIPHTSSDQELPSPDPFRTPVNTLQDHFENGCLNHHSDPVACHCPARRKQSVWSHKYGLSPRHWSRSWGYRSEINRQFLPQWIWYSSLFSVTSGRSMRFNNNPVP